MGKLIGLVGLECETVTKELTCGESECMRSKEKDQK